MDTSTPQQQQQQQAKNKQQMASPDPVPDQRHKQDGGNGNGDCNSTKSMQNSAAAAAAAGETHNSNSSNIRRHEILVPISVVCQEERANDGTCSRSNIDCITWCQVDAQTGQLVASRQTLRVQPAAAATGDEPNTHLSLAKAIEQVDKSIGAKRCLLVACGPLHLRQHLHPAAFKANLALADHYDRYADLAKEFGRRYGAQTLRGSGGSSSAASSCSSTASSLSCACSAPGSTTSSSAYASLDCNGSSASGAGGGAGNSEQPPPPPHCCMGGEQQQLQMQQQQYCYCCDYYDHDFIDQQQQQQQHQSSSNQQQLDFYPIEAKQHDQQAETFANQAAVAGQCQQVSVQIHAGGGQYHHLQAAAMQEFPQQHGYRAPFVQQQQQPAAAAAYGMSGQKSSLRQAEEMLKFLSIESQQATSGWCSSTSSSSAAANQASRQSSPVDGQSRMQTLELDSHNNNNNNNNNNNGCAKCQPQDTATDTEQDNPQVHDANQVLRIGSVTPPPPKSLAGSHCSGCAIQMSGRLVDAISSIIERMINEGHQFNRFEIIKRRVEVGLCDESQRDSEHKVVRARGLPWQATEQDIANFFVGLNIAKGGVGLCLSRQGRRNGEALIQFESREHRNLALNRHKHFMGIRYIEVYRANSEDFLNLAAGYNNKAQAFLSRGAQVIVRMRGLPFTCTSKQVLEFFAGNNKKEQRCEVLGQEDGILFVKNQDDKPTGDAFVLFSSEEHAVRALKKHKQNIGSRYVELFRSTISEVQQVLSISMDTGSNNNSSSSARSPPLISADSSPPLISGGGGARNNNANNANQAPGRQPRAGQHATQQQHQNAAWPTKPSNGITYAQVATSSFQAVATQVAAAAAAASAQPTITNVSPSGETINNAAAATSQRKEQAVTSVSAGDQTKAAKASDGPKAGSSCSSSPTSVAPATSGGSLDSTSAFDSNSLNSSSSCDSSSSTSGTGSSQLTSSMNETSSSSSATTASAAEHLLSSPSASLSAAQSPISSLSAASTGSSSYKSSQYGGGNGGLRNSGAANGGQTNNGHHNTAGHHHHNHQRYHHHHHNNINNNATSYQNYRNQQQQQQQQYHHHQQQQQQLLHNSHYHQHYGAPAHHYLAAHHHHHPSPPAYGYHHGTSGPHRGTHSAAAAAQQYQLHPLAAYHHHQQAAYAGQLDAGGHSPTAQLAGQVAPAAYPHLFPFAAYPPPPHVHPQAPYADPQMMAAAAGSSKRDCIRLRGLPFEAQVEDVLYFLGDQSKSIVYQGVHMVYSAQGQPTGEAIIQMNSCQSAANTAQEFHKKVMSVGKKQRYIEVIPCSIDDMNLMLGLGGLVGRSLLATPPAAVTPLSPATAAHYPVAHFRPPPLYPAPAPAAVNSVARPGAPTAATAEADATRQPDETADQSGAAYPAATPEAGDNSAASQLTQVVVDSTTSGGYKSPPAAVAAHEIAAPETPKGAEIAPPDSTTDATTAASDNIGNKLVQQQIQQPAAANLVPTAAAYYPILYYYPQQMLYQSHR